MEASDHYRFTFLVTTIFPPCNFWVWLFGNVRLKFYMFSIKMITFCKSAICPSSRDLLAYQNGEILISGFERIKAHLAFCEFCTSEIEFYAHYPQSEEAVTTVEIPIPLYELAHALLNNKHKDFSVLNQLLSENEVLG